MVELDGHEYIIQAPQENAAQAIQWVNQYCIDNNVKNLQGEVISIEISPGSPLYLLFLAFGYLAALCQNLIYGLGRMINIGSATDKQLTALGEIVRMRRLPASYTSIKGIVTASATETCNITTSLTAKIQIGGKQITFQPLFDIDIRPGSVGVIILQATSLGSFFVPANTITAFDSPPIGFARLETQASLPGRPPETSSQFRRRLQIRTTALSAIEKCVQALRQLPGIQAANIAFNYGNSPQEIQGYIVDARKAIGFIQGYNEDIAKVIFSYLMCDMMPLSLSQTYTLNNGQTLIAYWDTPILIPVFIEVYIRNEMSNSLNTAIINAIQSLSFDIDVASSITTADIVRIIQEQVPDVDLIGASVGLTEVGMGGQQVKSASNELFEFNRENIKVLVR